MSSQQHTSDTPDTTQHINRLIHETSPYLLQHAHNPVDWYPWGPEAFARAKAEDKPILLSIGYAACHWCHRLREESFENPTIARQINEHFVPVKVDREERPDVDALYMEAVQRMNNGSGGWPMTVFLMPDGAPFWGGTYFPPVARYNMPGFPDVLAAISDAWEHRRDEVEQTAAQMRDLYDRESKASLALPAEIVPATVQVNPSVLAEATDRLLARIDPIEGGFRPAPKFPNAMSLELLLRMVKRGREEDTGNAEDTEVRGGGDRAREGRQVNAKDAKGEERERAGAAGVEEDEERKRLVALLRLTLDKMAAGGIYDQLGGGFHRYSTDARWLVPHFEKMLYDNALLAPVYLHAWQLFGDPAYRRVCEETLDFTLRDMRDPTGGFYSTLDADSEGEEGTFYIWTPDELRAVLGPEDAHIAEAYWGVTARGNFEGANILHAARPVDEVAEELGMPSEQVREAVARARERLAAARAKRVWPARDEKVLAAWNGLLLRALAEAGRILGRDDYLQAALANASFLIDRMAKGGRLHRSWKDGAVRIDAFLEDYAAAINGLLSVYEASGEPRFFATARAWADDMLDRFWDEAASSFYDVPRDATPLIGRPRDLSDNATPAGSSLAAEALLRLAAYTGGLRYREYAARVLVPLAAAMADQPLGFGYFLCALDDLIGPFHEIAIVGAPDDGRTQALLAVVNGDYLPRAVLAAATPDNTSVAAAVPLLEGRTMVDGQPAAYVCQQFVCQRPVTTPDELRTLLP
ncbi:MAG TPA: thioredoxin domain-containing protein [Ktedonobacterales bacterium]